MTFKLKINIAGIDYTLTGEDENILQESAELVKKNVDLNPYSKQDHADKIRIVTVAALNIAEQNIIYKKQLDEQEKLISSELNKMSDLLESKLANKTN